MPTNTTPRAKATNDAYTGMLAISLIALLIGTGAIYMDYSRYAGQPPKLQPAVTERPALEPIQPKDRQPENPEPDKAGDKDAK